LPFASPPETADVACALTDIAQPTRPPAISIHL